MSAKGLLAGVGNSLWSAVIGLAVVPVYLRYLGVEAYGLIGVLATTQALVQLLDFGLATAVSREVSKHAARDDADGCAQMLGTVAKIYWATSLLIALALLLLAPVIAQHWIRPQGLSVQTITSAVELIGVVVAARWPIGLYQGILVGKQWLVAASLVNIASVSIVSLGSVLIVTLVTPSIIALFGWQALVGLGQALAVRQAAWRSVGGRPSGGFDLRALRSIWRFSAGAGMIAVLGVLLTQTDRVLLIRLLSLSDYGKYTLAAVVTASLYIGVLPTFNVLYPRFARLIELEDIEALRRTYHLSTALLAAVLFPLAGFLVVFSPEVVTVWTGDAVLASAVAPLVALLAAGSAIHGLMYVPHALQLAHGATHIPLKINGLLVFLQLPLLVLLTLSDGARGAALAWLLLHLAYCAIGTWLTHRQFLVGEGLRWLFVDAGIPISISILAALLAIPAKTSVRASPLATLGLGCAVLLLTTGACLLARRDVRFVLRVLWKKTLAWPRQEPVSLRRL